MIKRATIAAILAAITAPASAHDIWLTAGPGRVEVHYGHPADFSQPDKARLFDLSAVANGKAASLLGEVTVTDAILAAPLPKAASVVAARYDNGFWAQTTQGYRNTNRRNLPDALKSMWSQKFAKLLLPGDGMTQAVGQRLEIVPLADPFRLKPGERLKVRVDYAGKPLAGAEVEIGDGKTKTDQPKKAKADAGGIAEIEPAVTQTVLTVVHRVPGSVPDLATEDMLAATLTFASAP
ncbi:DUF4198 domain-containing protein [Paramagnetospirillum kuznetsovii]|uniref:DUF4198 domain-containing protein n=1 Tax=Paramagnetospirillum kuznetsovii TaxID=2053833 RepID=A0A364NSG2_9PROT|nr:DUF4198 domain-containing protein [Paramagnetospirillum kuznetsovii]RAU20029.1 DUF4198 domain-containing protein [Paramagnetospirillum kuznetsovii]